ncbi:MAG: hypothetical protein H6924_07095 [Alphaproteobacteria bacterium]|nr:hypothetical protein [Alphaproteobacteria bacterium]
MATELAARKVSGETISRQLGHRSPGMRTAERYIKNDPRHLIDAKDAIEDYLSALNRLTDRDVLKTDTFKILASDLAPDNAARWADDANPLPNMCF